MVVIEEIIDRDRPPPRPPAGGRCASGTSTAATGETNTTHYGQEIGDNRLPTIWQRAAARARGFAERRAEVARVERGAART